jgi:RsmE family RNA methyltransferase
MNLILLSPTEVTADGIARLTGARATHIREVLRASPGQRVRVGLIDGPMGEALVTSVNEATVAIACTWKQAVVAPQPVDVLLALPRPKVMRRLWSQLAALGVGQILVTNAARVERHYFDTHVLERATYEPLLLEGLQQARDTRLPRVSVHRRFKPLVEDALDGLCPAGSRVMADPSASRRVDAAVLRGGRVLLAIGPEGGWVDFERALLSSHGFVPVSMGARPLRTDTATVALIALAHDALREGPHGRRATPALNDPGTA